MITDRIRAAFEATHGRPPLLVSQAPGRVNVIGGHTDYNQGLVLPFAIQLGVTVALAPRDDSRVYITSVDQGDELRLAHPTAPLAGDAPDWQKLMAGCLAVFAREAEIPGGFDAVFGGDLPIGAGLSSSAALMIAWLTALRALSGATLQDGYLPALCTEIEADSLGVACGLLDPTASLLGRAGHLLLLDCSADSPDAERVTPIPADLDAEWLVIHTGIRRTLAGSAFSERVESCAEGWRALREKTGRQELTLSDLEGETAEWAPLLRHVFRENERVRRAVAAVRARDAACLGALMCAAHDSLSRDYRVSCPELDHLARAAQAHPAAFGGRMMGGGFGGCTLHLLRSGQTERYTQDVLADYRARFPEVTPRAIPVTPGVGAMVIGEIPP